MSTNSFALRSKPIAEFIADLIRDMHDGPEMLVFLLVNQPQQDEAVVRYMAKFEESYITFTTHTVFGQPFGLCILGFDATSPVVMSEFFAALAGAPFDEGAIYIRGRLQLRLLPNHEL